MKKYLKVLITVIVLLGLVGCSSAPKGESAQVLNDYYQNIKDGNIEGAYDKLAEASKKNFAKEDFIMCKKIDKEVTTLKETKVEKSAESKDKELDGVKYKNVVEFNVIEKVQDLQENKETTRNYKRNVVNDNGTWKVYREKENGKDEVAEASTYLAWMYIQGKGKTKDLNKAATILNDGLKYSKDYSETYYALGWTYEYLERTDEAINATNTYISKEKDNKGKSNGYNLLGVIYASKDDANKAKEYYNKALELDPNNQYAKTNLGSLK